MSGILRLESLTKGNTLKQGDKTPLKYRLFDADGEKLNIAGKSAKVRLVYPDFLTIGYEKDGLTVAQDDTVTFTIDNVIPSRIYHVEIIVDDKFIFPSRADESKFTVDKSSLGTEANIIEIVGVDAVVRKAVDLINVDPSLIIDEDKLVTDIISNTGIGSINDYYQAFNDLKPRAELSITKSAEALTKSQNALNVANGIDAKATNALSLSESADTLSKSVQEQFNQVIIDGDSSVEAAQARVDASGQTNPTLKARLDKEHNEVTTQLAQTEGGLASVQNANAKDFLRIENYLGNFENIHPKVINFASAWNGYKYWMAYTPYPGGDITVENPCIAVSNDLINWTVPTGLINPLDPNPGDGYNNDTHLLYRSDTNTIEIWWRYYRESDGKQLFYRRTSTNGVAWTSKEFVFTSDLISMVSPCVIFEGGKYKLWAPQGGGIIYMESSGSSVSTWTQPTTLNIDWGELRPWHMDIIRTDIGLEMVVQSYSSGETNNSADLYYVQGDGNAFTKPKLILAKNVDPQAFDSVGIYRSSLIKEKGMYHLFYSAIGPEARRAMALSSGRNIFGLNGVTDQNERMLTVLDDSKTELSAQEIRGYDKFRFMGDGVTELSLIRGGYEGQRITLIIGKKSRELKVVLKHNTPYLEMPNGKDFILETSGDYRMTMAVDLICQRINEWRVVGPIPHDPATTGKNYHRVNNGGTVDELDVTDIDFVELGGTGITVNSLRGGYTGKVVHFLTTSGATNATIVNSTRLITLGNTNYVFTPAKMGMTAICMSPEPYNVWRVF